MPDDELSPRDRLDLLRREEADRAAAVNAKMNRRLQAEYRQMKGTAGPSRHPGRPGWTDSLFQERYDEALAATTGRPTWANVAANFVRLDDSTGIEPDSLRKLHRRHGRKPTG